MKRLWASGNWSFGGSIGAEVCFDPEVPMDLVLFHLYSNGGDRGTLHTSGNPGN
jgi:hypothetical protein